MRCFLALALFIIITNFITGLLIIIISLINNALRSEMAMELFSHRHWFTHHHLKGGLVEWGLS